MAVFHSALPRATMCVQLTVFFCERINHGVRLFDWRARVLLFFIFIRADIHANRILHRDIKPSTFCHYLLHCTCEIKFGFICTGDSLISFIPVV